MITSSFISSIILLSSVLHPISSPQKGTLTDNVRYAGYQTRDQKTQSFLSEMAASRLVNIRQGNIAIQRGSSAAVREFARRIVKHNYTMIAKIKQLAETHRVELPGAVTVDSRQLLTELERWPGGDFDLKFSNLMIANHARDIIEFRNAILLRDLDVSDFALYHIGVLQANLSEIKSIKARLKSSGDS